MKKQKTMMVIAKSGNIYYAPVKKKKRKHGPRKKMVPKSDKPLFTEEMNFDSCLGSILGDHTT